MGINLVVGWTPVALISSSLHLTWSQVTPFAFPQSRINTARLLLISCVFCMATQQAFLSTRKFVQSEEDGVTRGKNRARCTTPGEKIPSRSRGKKAGKHLSWDHSKCNSVVILSEPARHVEPYFCHTAEGGGGILALFSDQHQDDKFGYAYSHESASQWIADIVGELESSADDIWISWHAPEDRTV